MIEVTGWPRCARCRKPVDAIRRMPHADGSLHFAVECHGELERTRLRLVDVLGAQGIRFGSAFRGGPAIREDC